MIDRAFVVAYFCIALGVLISTLQASVIEDPARRLDRIAGLGLPVLFLVLLTLSVVW